MQPDQFIEQARRSTVVMRKNILIYYAKGPVVIFGLIMPMFLFLAFYLGNRDVSAEYLGARLMAVTVFFTAAAVSPVIIPLEAQLRTLERLTVAPVATWAIVLGDILASFVFCLVITCLPLAALLAIGVSLSCLAMLLPVILLGSFCFSAMGLLFSAPKFNAPSDVMMIASVVKFSMVFVSGVFVPLAELPSWIGPVALLSPMTYFMDLVQYMIDGSHYLPVIVDVVALSTFTILLVAVVMMAHQKTMPTKI